MALEAYREGADRVGGNGSTTVDVGFIRVLAPHLAVLGSAGRVFAGSTGYQAYLGLRGTY